LARSLTTPSDTRPSRAPRIVTGALLFAAIAALASCGEPPEPHTPRHLVLISIDTLRADYLGAYGHPYVETPTIDGLAESGVLFENHISAAPTTLASHTSLMTGTWPHTHGSARNGFIVSQSNQMLAEILAARGFTTAGFLGGFPLSERFAFNQGFDHWDEDLSVKVGDHRGEIDQNQRPANEVTDAVLSWLPDDAGVDPLFLFVHYFDVHAPYTPPEKYLRMYRVDDLDAVGSYKNIKRVRRQLHQGEASPLNEILKQSYAAGVTWVDSEVGRLLAGLDERGLLDDAVVVITSDHGEAMDENWERWDHGFSTFETVSRTPLIVRLPKGNPGGLRVANVISNIDVVPTLLDLFGVELPASVEGDSFALAVRGDDVETPRTLAFSQATKPYDEKHESGTQWANERKLRSVRDRRFKLIERPLLGTLELFDLANDPNEQKNISDEQRERTRSLHTELLDWAKAADPKRSERDVDPEVQRRLEALGYVDEPAPSN
jgi:arylsulfatase A-like enzyme